MNEQWHETILYMPLALSVRDLYEIIIERLKIIHNDYPPIPSEEWIRLLQMLSQQDQCTILADLMLNLRYKAGCFEKVVMMHIIVQYFSGILENSVFSTSNGLV